MRFFNSFCRTPNPMHAENKTMNQQPTSPALHAETCCLSFEERCVEHDRLTAENAPPLNPQGKPDWMHPDFDRCSNDWWRLGLCDHCRANGGCNAHKQKLLDAMPRARKCPKCNCAKWRRVGRVDHIADNGKRSPSMEIIECMRCDHAWDVLNLPDNAIAQTPPESGTKNL